MAVGGLPNNKTNEIANHNTSSTLMEIKLIRTVLIAGALVAFSALPVFAQDCTPAIGDENLVSPGKLMLSINPTNPPAQFVDEKGELQGLNVEIARELGKRLCMEVELLRMDFPAMIPGVTTGRFDGMNTGMFWNEERSKILYMVPYGIQAIGVVVAPDSELVFEGPEDLAGHSSALETAGAQLKWLEGFNAENVAKGAEPIDIRTFPTATNAVSAVLAGQVDNAVITDFVARDLDRRGQAKEVLTGLGPNFMSMAFGKKAVADAVVAAFAKMREDGVYLELFDKYGMTNFPDDREIVIMGPGPA